MVGLFVAAAVLVFATSPAFAAEFYVAQSSADSKCRIVETKPDGITTIMVGTSSYASRGKAKAAKNAAAECNTPESLVARAARAPKLTRPLWGS